MDCLFALHGRPWRQHDGDGETYLEDSLEVFSHFFPFFGGHSVGVGCDAHSTQVEAVGVEACVDGGVACSVRRCMKAAGGLEHLELLVKNHKNFGEVVYVIEHEKPIDLITGHKKSDIENVYSFLPGTGAI